MAALISKNTLGGLLGGLPACGVVRIDITRSPHRPPVSDVRTPNITFVGVRKKVKVSMLETQICKLFLNFSLVCFLF